MVALLESGNPIYYPLTHPQKRIWYTENVYPDTALHNIVGSIRIKGSIDYGLLDLAIRLQIGRHEALRIRIGEVDGVPMQYVDADENRESEFCDFSVTDNPDQQFDQWLASQVQTPFVLHRDRLCEFPRFKISERDGGFLVKFHHIISDGWSSNLVIEQIYDSYIKLMRGEADDMPPAPSYLDYIGQEQNYLQSGRFVKNKQFWNGKFSGLPEHPVQDGADSITGKRKTYRLNPQRSSTIKAFAANAKCSINAFFTFLYMLYESKTSGQNDRVVGTPVFNRSGQKEKNTVGMYTSTMPFRFAFDESRTVMETLAAINHELTECYYNQKYPYDYLIQDLELKKKGYDRLFDTCVNYYNTKVRTEWDGWPAAVEELYNGNQLYALQVVVKDWSDSGALTLDIDFKLRDYTDLQVDELFARLNILTDQMIRNPQEQLGKLSLLSGEEESKLLYLFNATAAEYPRSQPIYRLFEEQAAKTPDRIAIRHEEDALTYRELNERSNCLARQLQNRGIGKETVVGLLTKHSLETVIGILAILKAGGAYLPIDPAYPDERIGYMLADSGCTLLLNNLDAYGFPFSGQILNLNNPIFYEGDCSNLDAADDPAALAYIIYTSGSTGKPKGVMIEHRGLVNYIWWAKQMYAKDDAEVFPLYSSLAFDLTVTSIFTPLITGGSIIIYRDDGDEYVLYRIMNDNRATVIKLTPSHLSLLKERDNRNSSVKRLIVGGEDLRASLAKRIYDSFGGRIELYNEYGPTETVVGCMIHLYDPGIDNRGSVPIGIPADNVQIYIFDSNLNPVPVNAIGELYISGDGIARGYRSRPDLTKDKFIPNPFAAGNRMYRTGDLAKFLDTGKIAYAGRADQQVKIRGFRIELGEIERLLCEHQAVTDAVVIDREHEDRSKYLCAYLVKRAEISSEQLRTFLTARLPEYMVPAHFIDLDEIPLNANGKVNRERLPEPERQTESDPAIAGPLDRQSEEMLLPILREVLQTAALSPADNFFHHGGDSIKAIQIASKLRNAGYGIKVADILSNPLIGAMLERVERLGSAPVPDQRRCEGDIRPTPIISWFFAQRFYSPNHYNQSILLHMKQNLDAVDVERIVNILIEHHDVLRMNVSAPNNELFYNEHARKSPVYVYRLAEYGHEEQIVRMDLLGQQFKSGFDLHRDALLKACMFDLGTNGTRLLLTAHHLVVDAVSWRILLEDFVRLQQAIVLGRSEPLPLKTASMQSWSRYLREHVEALENERAYWESVLDAAAIVPTDYTDGEDTNESAQTVAEQLTETETEQLLGQANMAYGTESQDLLIQALAAAVFEVFRTGEAVIELEGHGRELLTDPIDISRTVGWFTSLYPVRISRISAELPNQIKAVKETLRSIPRKGIGFGMLDRLSAERIDVNGDKRIRFNYLGDFDAAFNNSLFAWSNESSGSDRSADQRLTSLLDINVMVVERKLNVSVIFGSRTFKANTAERFIHQYVTHLRSVIRHCCDRDGVEYTPSDFDTIAISQEALDGLYL
jgi:amino acid adenylation domain-containing protein/non-ribosomal peptide synthase protein (TIGR01720 family)